MDNLPRKLFAKATSCGLRWSTSEKGHHRIEPYDSQPYWCLTCEQGAWVLVVGGFPQIRFRYDEVMKFLDRFYAKEISAEVHVAEIELAVQPNEAA